MIVCFTTTIRSLYHRDLLDVACLHRGEPVRFGYQTRHVESGLVDRTLRDEDALIVFADYVREPAPARYVFYPVRLVKIKEVRTRGGDVTLRFETGYWYYNPRPGALNDFRGLVDALPRRPVPGGPQDVNLFVVDPPTDELGQWAGRNMTSLDWLSTARLLRGSEGLAESTFFYQDRDGRAPDMGSTLRASEGTDSVWANRTYDVVLDVLEPRTGALEVPTIQSIYGSHVHGPLIRQSEGGLVTVTFKVSIPDSLVGSMWSARVGGGDFEDSGEPRAMMPELQATGKVRNSVGKVIALVAAAVFLILGHYIDTSAVDAGTTVFGFVLKDIGPLIFAVGVFLLLGVRRTALPTS